MGRSLILNASFEPLGVIAHRRAIVLVLREKAEVVERNGALYRSEHIQIEAPSVIRLRYYVHVPHRLHVAPSRKAVFLRDGHRCQYCGRPAENVDHVLPRSRGGRHVWDNVVAACRLAGQLVDAGLDPLLEDDLRPQFGAHTHGEDHPALRIEAVTVLSEEQPDSSQPR